MSSAVSDTKHYVPRWYVISSIGHKALRTEMVRHQQYRTRSITYRDGMSSAVSDKKHYVPRWYVISSIGHEALRTEMVRHQQCRTWSITYRDGMSSAVSDIKHYVPRWYVISSIRHEALRTEMVCHQWSVRFGHLQPRLTHRLKLDICKNIVSSNGQFPNCQSCSFISVHSQLVQWIRFMRVMR